MRKQPDEEVLENLYVSLTQLDKADQPKLFSIVHTRHGFQSRTKMLFQIKENGDSSLGTENTRETILLS